MKDGHYGLFEFSGMLDDKVRVRTFSQALEARAPGKHVLEIGGGTGFFACLAARKGASKVVSLDTNELIRLGEPTAELNELEGLEFHQISSQRYEPEEKADVLLHDIRGALPILGNNLSTMIDARERLLKSDGVFLPMKDSIHGCLVEDEAALKKMEGVWAGEIEGVDLTAARPESHFTMRYTPDEEARHWTKHHLGTLVYSELEESDFRSHFVTRAERDGVCHGMVLWFEMHLTPELSFSTDPWLPEGERAKTYGSAFLPWPKPVSIKAGLDYRVDLYLDPNGDAVALLSQESAGLRRTLARFAQVKQAQLLPFQGFFGESELLEAYRTALDAMADQLTVAEALERLNEKHPTLARDNVTSQILIKARDITATVLRARPGKSTVLKFKDVLMRLTSLDEQLLTSVRERLPNWKELTPPPAVSDQATMGLVRQLGADGVRFTLELEKERVTYFTEEQFYTRTQRWVAGLLARSTEECVILDCASYLSENGATLVIHDDPTVRAEVLEARAKGRPSSPDTTVLDRDGQWNCYGTNVPELKAVKVERVLAPAAPSLGLFITLALGRCLNPDVLDNPLEFFKDLLTGAELEAL